MNLTCFRAQILTKINHFSLSFTDFSQMWEKFEKQ